MEFEVRASKGIENCYVSLPLSLVQNLQSRGIFPQSLALELRSILNPDHVWFVAWSGSASTSAAIEVSSLSSLHLQQRNQPTQFYSFYVYVGCSAVCGMYQFA